jgi:hypothetical protein
MSAYPSCPRYSHHWYVDDPKDQHVCGDTVHGFLQSVASEIGRIRRLDGQFCG